MYPFIKNILFVIGVSCVFTASAQQHMITARLSSNFTVLRSDFEVPYKARLNRRFGLEYTRQQWTNQWSIGIYGDRIGFQYPDVVTDIFGNEHEADVHHVIKYLAVPVKYSYVPELNRRWVITTGFQTNLYRVNYYQWRSKINADETIKLESSNPDDHYNLFSVFFLLEGGYIHPLGDRLSIIASVESQVNLTRLSPNEDFLNSAVGFYGNIGIRYKL